MPHEKTPAVRPQRRARLNPKRAALILWAAFYGFVALVIYLITVVPTRTRVSDINPAFFLPMLPVGLGLITAGWFLAIDYQGMRSVFRRSIWVRMNDALPFSRDMAGPMGAGVMIVVGVLVFAGGIVAALTLLVKSF